MLLEGVKYLHVYTEEYYTTSEVLLMLGTIMAALTVLYFYLYYSQYKDKTVRYMAPMLAAALIMLFASVASDPEVDIYYECTISKEASFEAVYRKFEVTDARGDIYTLRMKNTRGEYWDLDKLIERVNENVGED